MKCRWWLAAAVVVGAAAATSACELTQSAVDKGTLGVREKAAEREAALADAASRGHHGVDTYVEASQSGLALIGDYKEINATTGVVDSVHVNRSITGGGWTYEDETVVLCLTYVIDVSADIATAIDTKCPDEVFDLKGEAGGDLRNATEVTLDD